MEGGYSASSESSGDGGSLNTFGSRTYNIGGGLQTFDLALVGGVAVAALITVAIIFRKKK